MISRMMEFTVFWLNALPLNSGMSCKNSLRTLMTGTTIDVKKHWKFLFGAYVKAHKITFPRNSKKSRTKPGIYLRPTGNLEGFYWFLNLCTVHCIKQRTFTSLPVPTRVINRVHVLANGDNQNPAFGFFDRLGNTIPYGNTLNNKNGDDAIDFTGVEE